MVAGGFVFQDCPSDRPVLVNMNLYVHMNQSDFGG